MRHAARRLALVSLVLGALASAHGATQSRGIVGRLPDEEGGGQFVAEDVGPHVSDVERKRIEEMLRVNRQRLEVEGRLVREADAAVVLDWPLAPHNGLSDFGYHGISAFVDQDPAYPNQILDYECGPRSYDSSSGYNHQGVDFFSWPFGWRKMDLEQVAIVAAAPGTILGKDDGNDDRSCSCASGSWNAVYVTHADGSTVWYGHMKKFSQTTKGVGETVAAGEFLGIVGSSGCSTGPHLHMELYDASNGLQEPYLGPCNVMNPSAVWWRAQRPYYDSAVNALTTGAAAAVFPTCPTAESPNDAISFPRGTKIYFTTYYRDVIQGQTSVFTIRRPDGSVERSWSSTATTPHAAASYRYSSIDNFAASGPDGVWSFEVDFAGRTYVHDFTIGCLSLAPRTLPAAQVGTPYSVTITASGGTPPYTFSVTGSLPPGLALSTGGVLAGTPLVAGTYGFDVTAADGAACSGTESYGLVVTGGGSPDNLLVGRGLGQPNPNQVRLFLQDGTSAGVDFLAYGAGQWGVNVDSGRVDGGASPAILTAPGPGSVFGPQVRGFQRDGTSIGKINFYAYGTLRYGANVSSGDIDDDGFDEIATGPGPGAVFGPHVRAFDFDGGSLAALAKINFFAYGTLRFGVNAIGGGIDSDPYAELVTGPGPGAIFGPQVRAFDYDGSAVAAIAKVNFNAFATPQFGVNVAAGDVEQDTYDEVLCAPGPGATGGFPARFVAFDFDGTAVAPIAGFDATPFATLYGGRVGAGDVTGEGVAELLSAPGRDPAALSLVMPHVYSGGSLTPLVSFEAFPTATYGVNPASGAYGF